MVMIRFNAAVIALAIATVESLAVPTHTDKLDTSDSLEGFDATIASLAKMIDLSEAKMATALALRDVTIATLQHTVSTNFNVMTARLDKCEASVASPKVVTNPDIVDSTKAMAGEIASLSSAIEDIGLRISETEKLARTTSAMLLEETSVAGLEIVMNPDVTDSSDSSKAPAGKIASLQKAIEDIRVRVSETEMATRKTSARLLEESPFTRTTYTNSKGAKEIWWVSESSMFLFPKGVVVGFRNPDCAYGEAVLSVDHGYDDGGTDGYHGSNCPSGDGTVVFGGGNLARGYKSSVTGGVANEANGIGSSISGGYLNIASGYRASVSGGYTNMAKGIETSISGGSLNTAEGKAASVSGGTKNAAEGKNSNVSGGRRIKAVGSVGSG